MLKLFKRGQQLTVLAMVVAQALGLAQALHPIFDSFAQFRLHITALLIPSVALLLLARSWKLSAAAALAMAAGLLTMAPAIPNRDAAPATAADLVLMQFNTLFDNRAPQAIVDQVEALRPDVITLQEVSSQTLVILSILAKDYPYQIQCPFSAAGAVAVLSKWQPSRQGCEKGLGLAWLEMNPGGKKITVASLHLHWPFPFRQASQISALQQSLRSLPRPVLLSGDFNAVPWSHAVARIAEMTGTRVAGGLRMTLKLALKLSNFGIRPVAILPIDQVLLPPGATAAIAMGQDAGSDHLPVIARITLAKE